MSVTVSIQPNISISFSSGSTIAILIKRLLYYQATHAVNVTLTGDYKTDREKIFGSGGFIKDAPLVKAVMMLCGYLKAKAYVTPEETFKDKIVSIYDDVYGKFFFIEVLSALMSRVTNYFQALQGVRDENLEDIKNDINAIINELIIRLKKEKYYVNFKIEFDDVTPSYTVTLEIYEK